MAYLAEIRIYDEPYKKRSPFNESTTGTLHLFERLIKGKLVTSKVSILSIHLTDIAEEHLSYHKAAGFLTIYYDIDRLNFSQGAPAHEIKKGVVDTVYAVLGYLSDKENLDINVIMDVYNKCIELDYKNEWWFKDKLIASPGRQYHIGLYHIYDTGKYEIYIVLFDKKKNELVRHMIFKTKFESFQIAKIAWTAADTVSYIFNGPQKVFTYTVDDLLNGRVMEIPEKIHLLFK